MQSLELPPAFYPISLTSLSSATATVVLASFNIANYYALWVVPGALVLTIPFHVVSLTLARFEPHGSDRLFSQFNVRWAFLASVLWIASLAVLCSFTVLEILKEMRVKPTKPLQPKAYLLLASALTCLLECVVIWWTTWIFRLEWKKISYAKKWRPVRSGTSSQTWRCVIFTGCRSSCSHPLVLDVRNLVSDDHSHRTSQISRAFLPPPCFRPLPCLHPTVYHQSHIQHFSYIHHVISIEDIHSLRAPAYPVASLSSL